MIKRGEMEKEYGCINNKPDHEKPKKISATIEKWKQYYQDKHADEAKPGGIIFKDLDKNAIKAEVLYYEGIECPTDCGTVSILDLKIRYKKAGDAFLKIDDEDKDGLRKQRKEIKKIRIQIMAHPMYPFWHTCNEALAAIETIEKLPGNIQEQIL